MRSYLSRAHNPSRPGASSPRLSTHRRWQSTIMFTSTRDNTGALARGSLAGKSTSSTSTPTVLSRTPRRMTFDSIEEPYSDIFPALSPGRHGENCVRQQSGCEPRGSR